MVYVDLHEVAKNHYVSKHQRKIHLMHFFEKREEIVFLAVQIVIM